MTDTDDAAAREAEELLPCQCGMYFIVVNRHAEWCRALLIPAVAAKIAELEALHAQAIEEWSKWEGFTKRAVEAMKRVPHLLEEKCGFCVACVTVACVTEDSLHQDDQCARLGGQCAFTALIKEIERG